MYKLKNKLQKINYKIISFFLLPFNWVFVFLFQKKYVPKSVLHISRNVHIAYNTVEILKKNGINAHFMALGQSKYWNKSEYKIRYIKSFRALQEFYYFWSIVSKYEVIHLHFMLGLSESGWELALLKKLNRKIVVHFRGYHGCEIRVPELDVVWQKYQKYAPCSNCDYNESCLNEKKIWRRKIIKKYGDIFLVTTPDLKDFFPEAIHFPFFAPEIKLSNNESVQEKKERKKFKIVHVSNHPGLEGTSIIKEIIGKLQEKGFNIEFVFLNDVPHTEVIRQYSNADLAIGKMKMGYYANAQIESMILGIPTITYIRPDFLTDELENSGFIITPLEKLEETLEFYLTNPKEIQRKKNVARASILKIHDNSKLAQFMKNLYFN